MYKSTYVNYNLGNLLSFHQKNFCVTSRVTTPAIYLGCTRGRGSSTRIYNWNNTHK